MNTSEIIGKSLLEFPDCPECGNWKRTGSEFFCPRCGFDFKRWTAKDATIALLLAAGDELYKQFYSPFKRGQYLKAQMDALRTWQEAVEKVRA